MMIDVHCHMLPGVDDGSKDLTTSLELAQAAVADGITHALMTPHHMNGQYTNHAADVIRMTDAFQAELEKRDIPLTVFPCQEVRINGQLLEAIDHHDILTCDVTGHYVLIEFPSDDVPLYTQNMLFEVMQRGMIPVIVHPERNTRLMKHPGLLYQMIERGAFAQVTASSYVGTFGKKVQQFSEDIIDAGLAHVFASDAHHLPGRSYEMSDAFKRLTRKRGEKKAHIFEENARALVNGDPLVRFNERKVEKRLLSRY